MRDKLIELMSNVTSCDSLGVDDCRKCKYCEELDCKRARTADYLIANGVTVQQWIPTSERLPEENCKCLVCVDVDVWGKEYKAIAVEQYNEDWLGWYSDGGKIPNVTHWMPLPSVEGLNDT